MQGWNQNLKMDSFRREFINSQINKNKSQLKGTIADFGGSSKKKSRSNVQEIFCEEKIVSINMDRNSEADIISNLENLPFADDNFDGFLLLEVLEHVKYPKKIIKEIHRVIKKNSRGFVSMPFLYQIHKAPKDYRRWTKDKLIEFFETNDFYIELITENGGLYSVIFDLIRSKIVSPNKKSIFNKLYYLILKIIKPIFKLLDKIFLSSSENITTGYFLIVKKK